MEVYHNNGVCTPSLTFVRKGVTIKRKTHGHGGVFVHLKTEKTCWTGQLCAAFVQDRVDES